MTHNKLSEVSYNAKITSWRFRVKIHRIYHFYSYVTSSGPFYKYFLADEEGTKMEITIYGNSDRFRGLEKQEGKWVEIFRVEVNRSYPDTMAVVFNTEAHFDDPAPRMVFYIRNNIQIKCVATGAHAYAFRDGLENMKGRGQVIVVLKMWRVRKFLSYFCLPDLWLETEGGLSDFRFNPRLPEVEEFRQSLLRSDPYVQRYEAVGLL
uniref:Replication protein A 70 kDa DNA-binding subunit B/D first OB fold domain-containing protein n=1 Tax=Brassica campestris TaxID=3711 RepID=M4DZL9_BRACM